MAVSKSGSVIIGGVSNAAFATLTGCTGTRTGTVANIQKTAHTLNTSDIVLVQNFSLVEFNGVYAVTRVDADNVQFTMRRDPLANPASASGTMIKGTRSSLLDLSNKLGARVFVTVQNGSAPGAGAQVWVGECYNGSGTNDYDYDWRRALTHSITANDGLEYAIDIPVTVKYAYIAIFGNTTNAVDIECTAHILDSI